jgi:hypothetical protein
MNFIKKRKGATQVYRKYIRETPNQKIKKITKAIKMKAIQGNCSLVKGIEE